MILLSMRHEIILKASRWGMCICWGSEYDILYKTCLCIFCHVNLVVWITGSVKDSVVGEERIAQYLLAVLDTRGTPLHWKHLNNRRIDGIAYEAEEYHRYDLKNLKQRRSLPNRSDLVYVEVTNSINGIWYFICMLFEFFDVETNTQ